MKKKYYTSEIKNFFGKTAKENITKYEITCFGLSSKNFPIPLLSSYYMNSYVYMLVRKGRAQVNISGYSYNLCQNSIVSLVPSHTAQFVDISDDFKSIGLILTSGFYNIIPSMQKVFRHLIRNLKLFNQPVLQLDNEDFFILLNSVLDVQFRIENKNHLMHRELIQNTYIKFLLEWANSFDKHILENLGDNNSNYSSQILNNFVLLLRENYREKHLVSFYADSLCISPQYLTLIVKKTSGKTISQFIYDLLYSEANILLNQTNLSIQEIAEELCFSDASAFCKFFKRRSGLSPLKYRNK